MAKKKEVVAISEEDYKQMLTEYDDKLESDPKYSLQVDPTDKYNLSDLQKSFIETYVDVKNVVITAQMLQIDDEAAMQIFNTYACRKEIERISMAQLQRRIRKKMWDYEQIGGYLTTFLTEENVPLAERLSSKDKIGVARTLIDLNDRKAAMAEKPIDAASIDLDAELKELSVDTIKSLLEQDNLNAQKKDLVKRLKSKAKFSMEEEQLLQTMTVKELLQMLNEVE